jgi:hypothetical protein
MEKIIIASALAAAFAGSVAQAQVISAVDAPASVPTHIAPPEDGGMQFSGYLDASYNYLSESSKFTGGTSSRVFDLERNAGAIRQLAVTLAAQPKQGLGGLLNLTAGKDADIIGAYGLGAGKKNKFDVTQAFVQYATGPFTVIGGKFVTMAGAEVINSTANNNFSRSILFGYAIPFTHTGARGTYAASDNLSLMFGVNNGWDNFKDTNNAKTLEFGLSYTPSKIFALAAQAYSGKERVGGFVETGPEGTRNLVDLVGTFNASDKLTFILNYDYATQTNTPLANGATGTAKWSGLAGYANYQINDQWRLSGRAEYFDDKDGYRTGVVQKWKEATLTVAYLPTKNLELRAEVRADNSNVASFLNSSGTSAGKSQQSIGVQALYKF